MSVPSDYQRSERERFFVLAYALRRGNASEQLAQGFRDGILALASITSSEVIKRRILADKEELKLAS